MRYGLGEFQPDPDSGSYAHLLHEPEFRERRRKALEQLIEACLSESTPTPDITDVVAERSGFNPSDLLSEIKRGHTDEFWVRSVHDRLNELDRSLEIRLLACEFEPGPDGFLCIAATSASVEGEVTPGDWVQAGMAALRDRDQPVRISQRIFRRVCANGAIVSVREIDYRSTEIANAGEVVGRCFHRGEFENSVQALREAAQIAVADPRRMLNEVGMLPDPITREFMRRWTERTHGAIRQGLADRTLWDFMNDMTEVARDLPDWRDRLDLEETAGRLAKLRPPVPRLSPRRALTLTGA